MVSNTNNKHKEKSGFEKSLEGEQTWPPIMVKLMKNWDGHSKIMVKELVNNNGRPNPPAPILKPENVDK